MIIKNKIYELDYVECIDCIFINKNFINPLYRSRGYSIRIINNLANKYKNDIYLHCFPKLYDYYIRLGFIKEFDTVGGYYEM